MKKLAEEMKVFLYHKGFMLTLVLTAAGSYGFTLFHPSIGIDDTAVDLYFSDGLAVVMGRWFLFLLNKVLPLSELIPLVIDLAGVLLIMLAAVLFCVFLKRGMGSLGQGMTGYALFAGMFVANPITSEVFIYYCHNGIGLGYVFSAVGLLLFQKALSARGKTRMGSLIGSLLLVWCAVGCYESFLLLYILGILVAVFMRGMKAPDTLRWKPLLCELGTGAFLSVGVLFLRMLMIPVMTLLFGLQDVEGLMNLRSISEVTGLLQGGRDVFLMLVKRFWLVYHVNAFVYLPVTVYELAVWIVGAVALYLTVRYRKAWYFVLYIGMLLAPFLMTLIEVRVTHYRTCQYLPFFAAFGYYLLYQMAAGGRWKKVLCRLLVLAGAVLIFNQAAAMNRDFYNDYRKYEWTKETLNQIAYEVERSYGTDVPVLFTGHGELPFELISDYYVPYSSRQYRWIAAITDLVDEHLKEKYFAPQGYSFIGEAQFPFMRWAVDAFDGTNREMIRFLEIHGHSFPMVTDEAVIEEAELIGNEMPTWPQEGSIRMQDGYVLIHI